MSAVAFVAAGFGFSSCDIDMLPLNEVVLENFWTNKDDVESVVASCYVGMKSDDYIERLIIWGEDRSDNVVEGNSVSENLKLLLKGSIKTTNKYCDWASFYQVINKCNTVLLYAPQVAEKDPNYTSSDLQINIAECKFMRAYSYLTLVKTFKDVPFTFEASIDDNQTYRLTQTPFTDVLDSLILDIEGCKNYAPRRYSKETENTGKVTRAAMYSLLSELYLWRASDANLSPAQQNEYYRKCIENCDWVLNFKWQQYDENDFDNLDIRTVVDKEVLSEYGYPLLAEELTPGTNQGGPKASKSIFGTSNDGVGSFESIFEIKFNSGSSKSQSSAILNMYGKDASSQNVVANEKMLETKPDNNASYTDNKLFSVPSDYRVIANFYFKEDASDYNIYKYVVASNEAGDPSQQYGRVGSSFTAATRSQSYGTAYPNWILYRMSEIMLFRAEAEIEMAFNMDASEQPADTTATSSKRKATAIYAQGSNLSSAIDLKCDAFDLISAVYRRSNPVVKTQSKYAPSQPTSLAEYRKLLMNERRREFLFEGKRYYDLVRLSRRVGNTQDFRTALSSKYGDAGASVAIKMVQMDFMYMPIFKTEMKVNPNLHQNPCYLDEEENIKN